MYDLETPAQNNAAIVLGIAIAAASWWILYAKTSVLWYVMGPVWWFFIIPLVGISYWIAIESG